MRHLVLALLPFALAACGACGSLLIEGTTATNYEGHDYNGSWSEQCGVNWGTTGVWAWADGFSEIWFDPNAPGDRGWQAIDIEITVGVPTDRLVPGETIGMDALYGGAALNPCIDCPQDGAALSAGTIEVISGFDGDDPCAEEDGPTFLLRWDLEFGTEGGPRYTMAGRDAITFSTFVSEACTAW